MLKFGKYPVVTRAQAHENSFEARELPTLEIDRAQKRRDDRQGKVVADGHYFEAVARDWWARWQHTSSSQHHIQQTLRRLKANVFRVIGLPAASG